MLLVDTAQTGRALEVRVNDHNLALVVLLGRLVEHGRDGIAELDSACSSLLGTSDQEFGVFSGLDRSEDVGALGVSRVEVSDCGLTKGIS